jgi:photosystem II stability/assembly factor-like uncharacterized protein
MKKMKLSILTLLLSFYPVTVFAHGTEEEHQKEELFQNVIMYSLIGTALLVVIFLVLLIITKSKVKNLIIKKKDDRMRRDQLNQKAKFYKWLTILSAVALLLVAGLSVLSNETNSDSPVTFKHIHGLAYTNDGEKVYVPSHHGINVFSDGEWEKLEGEEHDYMGFSMVDNGFYSSGHPAEGSGLKNPLGIVKSTDGGQSLEMLDLYGEVDFHGMAAGFQSHVIYVINHQPNSRMKEPGIYYTLDEAKTWKKSKLTGLNDRPLALVVHPTKENFVAVGTQTGVYMSKDYGDSFDKIDLAFQVSGFSFTPDGNLMIGGVAGDGAKLFKVNVETNEASEVNIPTLEKEDYVVYIAQNPKESSSMTITTLNKDIFLTEDNGESWVKIANDGQGISQD